LPMIISVNATVCVMETRVNDQLGCSYQDARLLRRQSCGINRFVPVRQLTP